ncbi:MAG TPA: cytochrome d ubiquinol oxidase subunit II [Methylomirabilota bacterium]|jgi:cytochrome d ubiquinol oxidase subunit II
MTAELGLALITLAALVLYALSGGADYGGGMWDLLATGPRAQRQRDVIEHAIGPIWEANHVWLILVVVVLFTAFPPAFGAMMTALHIPVTLVLLGVVLRGSAFAFRKYDPGGRRRWGTIFGVASLATPFFLGLTLGGLASGDIRVQDGRITTGFFAGWTSPFAVAVGAYAQGLFAFLAAVYLTVDAEGDADVQEDFRRRALVAGVALAPVAAAVFALARDGAPQIFRGLTDWWAPLVLIATSLCAVGALVALWMRRFRMARMAAAGQVSSILIGWALAQYPYLLVPDITIAGAATAAATLRLLLWTLALGAIMLLPSFAYLFYVFRGRA